MAWLWFLLVRRRLPRLPSFYVVSMWALMAVWMYAMAIVVLYFTVHDDPWRLHGRHDQPSTATALGGATAVVVLSFIALARAATSNLVRRPR